MRRFVIYRGEADCSGAACAILPSCVSQGRTMEEAIRNNCEAIEGYGLALNEDGFPVEEFKGLI